MRKQVEEVDLEGLLSAVRADPKYKLFKNIILTAGKRLTIESDRNEAFALHASRSSRKLHGKKNYSPSAVTEAAANDMSVRSRLVEIRTRASYHIEVVEKAMEAFQDHLITEYNEELRKYSNEAQRKALIRRTQKVAHTVVTDGKDLLSLCDTIIQDIDKASYHITNIKDLIQQLAQSIGGKVV